jgi:hypothetical protein
VRLPLTFEDDWLRRDRSIGANEMMVTARASDRRVRFALPRTLAVKHVTVEGSAALSTIADAWGQAIKTACANAFARVQNQAGENHVGQDAEPQPIVVIEQDFEGQRK